MTRPILIVEDNRDLADNLRELFEETGALVSLAHDTRTAAQLMNEQAFDLAILDVNLPGGSGLEVLPKLKETSPYADAVLVTGDATIDSAIEAVRHGVFAYVQKPFDPDDLVTIAERALAQVSLRRERAELSIELARSEALYHEVVDSVHSLLVGVDRDLRVRMWNHTIAEVTGWEAAEVIDRDALELLVEPEHRDALEEAFRRGVRSREVVLPLRTRSGAQRIVRWRFAPLGGATKTMVLVIGEDVTERLALEARAAEAEALAAMGRLTAGLAHEIRNPLNAATLQLELISRAAARLTEDEAREKLVSRSAVVRSELTRLTQLLDEFLGLARPQHLAFGEVDVGRLLDELAAVHAPAATEAGVTLSVERGTELPRVRGDDAKLRQALVNLIVNAIDAMRERGHGILVLAALRDGERVELRVEDDGPGLPPLDPHDLFRAFVTTKKKGTGLGLAIVKQIVENHGGTIDLAARDGGGTIARVRLPALLPRNESVTSSEPT